MTSTRRLVVLGLCVLALAEMLGPGGAGAQTKLLRFPDIHGDRVVFMYAGDLWTASVSGGMATRATRHTRARPSAAQSPLRESPLEAARAPA